MSASLDDRLLDFIAAHVDTLDQLEILLLLASRPKTEWTAAAVARELCLNAEATEARLVDLQARGFLVRFDGRAHSYQYYPADVALAAGVAELGRQYAQRRVAVITAIFSPRPAHRRVADVRVAKRSEDGE